MVFHFGSAPNFMPRSPFEVLIHTVPFATGIFASELLLFPVLRKFPTLRFSLAEAGIGWVPYWLERADIAYQKHHAWTGQDFGDKQPSQVFRERVLTCFIEDTVGLAIRDRIGWKTSAGSATTLQSDSSWPQSPAILMKSSEEIGVPDGEIELITWKNACDFYRFQHLPRDRATVGALRAEATDVDAAVRALSVSEDHESFLEKLMAMQHAASTTEA